MILISDIGYQHIGRNPNYRDERATALRYPICVICGIWFTSQWLQPDCRAFCVHCVWGSHNMLTQGSFLYANSNTARGQGDGGSSKGERENSRQHSWVSDTWLHVIKAELPPPNWALGDRPSSHVQLPSAHLHLHASPWASKNWLLLSHRLHRCPGMHQCKCWWLD